MKYIAGEYDGIQKTIIMFPEYHSHDDIARMLRMTVRSAGFVNGLGSGNIEKIECTGRSVSLNVESHPDDTEKLQNIIRGY